MTLPGSLLSRLMQQSREWRTICLQCSQTAKPYEWVKFNVSCLLIV